MAKAPPVPLAEPARWPGLAVEPPPDHEGPWWPFDPGRNGQVRHRIVADLWPLAVPLDTLHTLPGNPRKGDVQAMRTSLSTYGQRKPVVVNVENQAAVVEAGNHTLKAARAEDWTHLAIVRVRDDPDTELGYALADNRVAELGRFDMRLLAEATGKLQAANPALLLAAGYTGLALDPAARTDPEAEWVGMPEYESERQIGVRVLVHFPDEDAAERFYTLIGQRPQNHHNGLPALWWPERPGSARSQFTDEAYRAVDPGDANAPDA